MTVQDAFLLLTAGITLTFGLLVFAEARRPGEPLLGYFLLLVALGSAILGPPSRLGLPHIAWLRMGLIVAGLAPIFLYGFVASSRPEPTVRDRHYLTLCFGGFAAVLAFALFPQDLADPVGLATVGGIRGLGLLFLMLAFFESLRRLLRWPGDVGVRLLFGAVALIALPGLHTLGGSVLLVALSALGQPIRLANDVLVVYLPLVVFGLGLSAYVWRRPSASSVRVYAAGFVGAGILLAILEHSAVLRAGHGVDLPIPARTSELVLGLMDPVRWIVAMALLSKAMFTHRLVEFRAASRRRAARSMVGVVAVAIAALGIITFRTLLGEPMAPISPIEIGFLLVALAASQGFYVFVSKTAARLYGVPEEGGGPAALELYERAVHEAASEGRLSIDAGSLAALRDELAISPAAAMGVERLVESTLAAPLTPGAVVGGRYELVRLLGRGGSGRVFAARDRLVGREVAVKEVLGGSTSSEGLREAQVMGRLQHPNVVTLYDVVSRPGATLLVTEFLENGSLHDRLANRSLTDREAVHVAKGMLAGLAEAHRRGIVHADLKPGNILLDGAGTAKLGDFGIATAPEEAPTGVLGETGAARGTPGFAAPEVARGSRPTTASDLYAAGRILALLRLPDPRGRLAEVLARATAEDPGARFRSAEEIGVALALDDV
ncbi:MAG: protein kinase domain-containing protein [Methanobacteriota archaeon]